MKKLKFKFFLFFSFSLFAQQSKIDSLLSLLQKDQPDTNKVNHLNVLSNEYRLIGEFNFALHYGNLSLDLGKKINFPKGIANAYNSIGVINLEQGNYAKALDIFTKNC